MRHPRRQPAGLFGAAERRGAGGEYTGLCFESSSRWCCAAGSGSARGCRRAGGLPRHPWDPPCPPRRLLPQPGAGCSGFAVGRAVPEGGGELAEGGSVLGAGRPAALHQLGEPRRAALGGRELRLSRLQPWCGSRGWRGVGKRRDPLRAASGDTELSPRRGEGVTRREGGDSAGYLLRPHRPPAGCRASRRA